MMPEITYKGKKSRVVKTCREVARAFGVADMTVSRWKKRGMPVEDGGGYDLLKVGLWSGRVDSRKDETFRAEVLALSDNTTMTAKDIAEKLGITKDRVDNIRKIHRKDKPLGDFVTDKKAELLAIEQGKGHLVRERMYDRLLNMGDDEIADLPV